MTDRRSARPAGLSGGLPGDRHPGERRVERLAEHPSSTRTVDRALALLAVVCRSSTPVSLTECARLGSLPASTALRLLRTLGGAGFVSRDAAGAYRPGVRALQLGALALGSQSLVGLAQPALARIVERTGESNYLVVRGSADTAVYLAVAEGTHPVRHTSWVGRSIDLADLAVGSALRDELPAAGFLAGPDRRQPDITAIAAAVRAPGGVVAALNLLGPTYRLDQPTADRYGRIVADEADALAVLLGVERAAAAESDRSAENPTEAS